MYVIIYCNYNCIYSRIYLLFGSCRILEQFLHPMKCIVYRLCVKALLYLLFLKYLYILFKKKHSLTCKVCILFGRCHSLAYLSVCFCEHISEAGIELLGQTHSLVSLDISGCACGDQGLSAVCSWQQY